MPDLGSTQTERLRLERWSHEAHGDGFAAMNAQPEVLEYLGGGPGMTRAESDEASAGISAHWDAYGFGLWAAVERATGAMLGFVASATRCGGLRWSLGLDEIVSFVHPGNERSLAVTRRLGMSLEGDVPHPARPDTTVRILAIAAAAR